MKTKKKKRKEKKELFRIYQAIRKHNFETITLTKTSKEIWYLLEKVFERIEKVEEICLQTLRSKFKNLKMKLVESIANYVNRIIIVTHQMKWNSENVEDAYVI